MQSYQWVRDEIILEQDIDPEQKSLKLIQYAKHVFYNGLSQEARDLVQTLDRQLYLHDRAIVSLPLN